MKNNYRYVGQTNNLHKRLEEHNFGKTKSTKFIKPFILEYFEEFKTRLEAIRRERFLKSGKGREWLDLNIKSRKECSVGRIVA